MARIYTLIFLLFTSFNSFAQQSREEVLLAKLASEMADSAKADIYLDLHNEVFKTNLDKAKEYANGILKYGLLAHRWGRVMTGYLALSRCEQKSKNYDAVIPYDFKALDAAKRLDNVNQIFICTSQIANDYMDAEKTEEAFKYLLLAETLANQTKKPANIGKAQESLGYYYNIIGQPSKAVSYLRKAISNSTQGLDFYRANRSRNWLGQCLVQLNQTEEVPELIFTALDYYKKSNVIYSQIECYKLLGYSYQNNNNPVQAIKNYLLARQIGETTNNKADQGLVDLELGRCYIQNKEYGTAKKYIVEAEQLFKGLKYEPGSTDVKTLWGQYYTETKQYKTAEPYFKTAQNLLKKSENQDMLIQNEMYWAANAYRQQKYKLGDSLTYDYSKRIADSKEQGVINNTLAELRYQNKQMSNKAFTTLKILYTKGGGTQIKKRFGNKSLKTIIPMIDSLNVATPYTNTKTDSAVNTRYNNQLLKLETQFRTRIKNDSLKLERQNALIVKDDLKVKNNWLIGSSAFVLLLAGGFMVQRKYRIQAEEDKKRIELLKNEIHHRIKNNLGVINRMVDVAEKASITTIPSASLKNRVNAIGLLHEHLYQNQLIDKVDMQSYLTGLVEAIKETFENGTPISTEVDAPIVLSGSTSEKIGLIVNELVTNSYKYAFAGLNNGLIKIGAKRSIKGEYQLQVSDNGIGINMQNNIHNYGMKLIAGLCYELGGTFSFKNDNGTCFELKFTDTVKK